VIVLAVRWYLRFGLSFRDVEELLAERGVEVDHVTVYRWVQRFTTMLAGAARPCRHAVGNRWHVDETYMKVAGRWCHVYRAIDQFGQVIDIFVSAQHHGRAARRFFERAIGTTKITPVEVVTTMRRCTWRCSRSCCRRSGIAPIGMPTTTSSVTTAG
jgi:transposase-like protein